MLVVVSTNLSSVRPPPTELAPDKVINDSVIYGVQLLPAGVLAPAPVVNLSVIHDHTLQPLIPKVLTPAQVVNTSTINVHAFTGTAATSYDNAGGKGERTALITVLVRRIATAASGLSGGRPDNMVDGAFGASTTDAARFTNAAADYEVYFDFRPTGFKQIIDEITWRQSTNDAQGTWVVEAWNGNGAWVELKSNFALGGATVQVIPFFNSYGYLVYRMRQVAGTTTSAAYATEVEFKIAQGAAITSATAYTNAGGTGDRRAAITMSGSMTFSTGTPPLLIDGTTNASQTNFGVSQSGKDIKFDFGTAKTIDEFRWYAGNANNHGAWIMSGSNDDAAYEQLGTPFRLQGASSFAAVVYANIAGNVKGYRHYKMAQINGMQLPDGTLIGNTTNGTANSAEIEFKIAA